MNGYNNVIYLLEVFIMRKNDINRRDFLKRASILSASIPLIGKSGFGFQKQTKLLKNKNAARPLNVVFILSDDHRYDFMGFMGKPSFLKTPNMDRMAKGGAHLKNAFVATALCSPSRASILTGLYAHNHGVVNNQSLEASNLIYFPQYLQQAGYKTAFIGKWHMGEDGADDSPREGFDKWISFKGQGVYYNPELNIDGQRVNRTGYITDILTDYATDWIKNSRNNKFFLYLSHKAVHAEFEPAERHRGMYANAKIEYPKSMANTEENYQGKPSWVKAQRNSWHGVDYMYHGTMDFDGFYKNYCETLLALDESIGKVLDTLEELGLSDNTLVMYMGDNGFCLGEHGLIDKRHMYEESMRVPLLAYCPSIIKAGTIVEKMVQNIDIAPTILDAAGLIPPEGIDGKSFFPLLREEDIPWKEYIFYEYFWEWNFPHTPTTFGVRTDRYKYITYHGVWEIDEVYDIINDPYEMHNLAAKNPSELEDNIISYNKLLFNWLENTKGMQIPLRPFFEGVRRDSGKFEF